MVVNKFRSAQTDLKAEHRKSIIKWSLLGVMLLGIVIISSLVWYEASTSRFQAKEISHFASALSFELKEGPSDAIIFPKDGPFDVRLGYSQMPSFLKKTQEHGMIISSQSKFSPELVDFASNGYFTPYIEKNQTGLNIIDSNGKLIYNFRYPRRVYTTFDSIPAYIVNSLLFIEDRQLLDTDKPYLNPAVDWVRFTKASLLQAAIKAGFDYKTIGGSTLATQIEKYRHSPSGITAGPKEKIQQMFSASVRAYQRGEESMPARKDLVLAYVNTVPLSGAPGYGEVHGIGDGLWVWFGSDMQEVNKLLQIDNPTDDIIKAQGQALRQVLSLMIAQRRPSFYLGAEGRDELNTLTGGYLRLLATNGYISNELRDAGLAQEVQFRNFNENPPVAPRETDKSTLVARTHISSMLGKTLYDLDRLDLTATTTLETSLQRDINAYLKNLNNADFAKEVGVLGKRLLKEEQTEEVRYSFTLFEQTPQGNLVRVQTDNTDQPFDLNVGSKLELGSTAKLRVLITYLDVIAEVHAKYASLPASEIRVALQQPQDNLTNWVLQQLYRSKNKDLTTTLQAALERKYSASPWEPFYTGGGVHYFHNFRKEDNGTRPTVREAFQKSINLPFVRIMRDIVRYTMWQDVGNYNQLISNPSDERRREYLTRFADREGKVFLLEFWQKYKGKTAEERFETLLNSMYKDPVRLATVHRYLYPETSYEQFETYLRTRLPEENIEADRVLELYERYGPEAYNLPDQGYIAKKHPLELWLLRHMLHNPNTDWNKVVEASVDERQEVYKWLFRTRFKNARDSRIRTILESDAFEKIQARWAKVGYPFDKLVPSLATALGSSGDRPEALAELMGIIMNDGVRKRTKRIEDLHFAAQTPYETAIRWQQSDGVQVLPVEVAATVREALTEVVDVGTARRLQGGFSKPDGSPIAMGGKTGTGDNRLVTMSSRGYRISSRAINRTATFVFFLGDRHFGTLTAFVPGREAADFSFTSSLPVQVLKGMAPILSPYLSDDKESQEHLPENTGQKKLVLNKEEPVIKAEEPKIKQASLLKVTSN